MSNKLNEEYIKEGAQKVTEKDIEKVVNRSEEIKRKSSVKGILAALKHSPLGRRRP